MNSFTLGARKCTYDPLIKSDVLDSLRYQLLCMCPQQDSFTQVCVSEKVSWSDLFSCRPIQVECKEPLKDAARQLNNRIVSICNGNNGVEDTVCGQNSTAAWARLLLNTSFTSKPSPSQDSLGRLRNQLVDLKEKQGP